jgi:signal transduction histidine kinase
VHNIIKHAGASHIWLQLELRDAQLQVTIKDDGRGFDPKKMTSGNGLANIRKRIQAVSGQIHIENNQGTVIHFSVPL